MERLQGFESGHLRPYDVELKTEGAVDVHVTRNAIAVGWHSGWHQHPGPSLINVNVGEIMAFENDNPLCTPKRYVAGEGFVYSGDRMHHAAHESGSPAETVAVQFLPTGSTRQIDADNLTNCAL